MNDLTNYLNDNLIDFYINDNNQIIVTNYALNNYEKNLLLVALDHMAEHLESIEQDGSITVDTYKLRMETLNSARTKIKNVTGNIL